MMTKTGTVAFSAPEIFMANTYNEKVDIWSAGVVLYMMICGNQPFYEENVPKLVHQITHEEPDMTDAGFRDVSSEGLELLKKMLQKDPANRPSADEALKHPWFMQHLHFEMASKSDADRYSDPTALMR